MSEVETLNVHGTLRAFGAYLRRPVPAAPIGLRSGAAWRELAVLFVLQSALLLAVISPLG